MADALTTTTAITAPTAALKSMDSKGMSSNVRVPFASLQKLPGFNVRSENDEYKAAVRSLADSIKANGFYDHKPLGVFKIDGQKPLFIHDGHTRYDALALLASEGTAIAEVPVALAPAGTTVEDLTVSLVQSNEGRPLAPIELATVVKRLLTFKDDKNWVAERIGKTVRYLDNLLILAGAPAAVRTAVANNKIAAAEAVKIVRKDSSTAAATVAAKVKEAEAKGKAKATPKTAAAAPTGPRMKRVFVEFDMKAGDKLGDVLKDNVAKAIRAEIETDKDDLIEDAVARIGLAIYIPDYEAIQAAEARAKAATEAKVARDKAAAEKKKAADAKKVADAKAKANTAKAAATPKKGTTPKADTTKAAYVDQLKAAAAPKKAPTKTAVKAEAAATAKAADPKPAAPAGGKPAAPAPESGAGEDGMGGL